MRSALFFLTLTACAQSHSSETFNTASDTQSVIFSQPSVAYRGVCDGSAAAVLDDQTFLDLGDETQQLAIFRRGAEDAIATRDLSEALGLAEDDEADFEDAARLGDRIYVVSSHGRNKDGELAPARQRFFALEQGTEVVGYATTLVRDMLDEENWEEPDEDVLDTLWAATRLDLDTEPDLAPQENGLNIEGLAAWRDGLLIGLRNPTVDGSALLVTLLNPAELIEGAPAHFGEAFTLDLDGLGIRAMTFSQSTLFVIAGSSDDATTFSLYAWDTFIRPIKAPKDAAPEALLAYPDGSLEVLFDRGDAKTDKDSKKCKNEPAERQWFAADTLIAPVD